MSIRKTNFFLIVVLFFIAGCSGTTILNIQPPNAKITVNGLPVKGNSFDYDGWIGNIYKISVSAEGYQSKEITADVDLGSRAGLIAAYSIISIIGIPNLFALPWYGQIDDEIFIYLDKKKD